MTHVAKIINASDTDRVFAFEILAAYWRVRSDPSNNEAKAIRVSSRPDQVWRASEKTEPGQKGNLKNLCKGVRDLLLLTPVDAAHAQRRSSASGRAEPARAAIHADGAVCAAWRGQGGHVR